MTSDESATAAYQNDEERFSVRGGTVAGRVVSSTTYIKGDLTVDGAVAFKHTVDFSTRPTTNYVPFAFAIFIGSEANTNITTDGVVDSRGDFVGVDRLSDGDYRIHVATQTSDLWYPAITNTTEGSVKTQRCVIAEIAAYYVRVQCAENDGAGLFDPSRVWVWFY